MNHPIMSRVMPIWGAQESVDLQFSHCQDVYLDERYIYIYIGLTQAARTYQKPPLITTTDLP